MYYSPANRLCKGGGCFVTDPKPAEVEPTGLG